MLITVRAIRKRLREKSTHSLSSVLPFQVPQCAEAPQHLSDTIASDSVAPLTSKRSK